MLQQARLDAVWICVPPFAHGQPELDALDAGVPFFVEKPLALDRGVAEDVAAAVESSGLPTATGYHWRYLDTVELALERLAAAPCHLVVGSWFDRTPGNPWWAHEDRSGGQLIEQVTHVFDLARLLVGEVVQIRAEGKCSGCRGAFVDVSMATLRFAGGAIGSVTSTCLLRSNYRIGLELFCDGLVIAVTEHELIIDDGVERCTRRATTDPFLAEDRDFLAAVRGDPERIRVPYREALVTHRLATAAARAARDGTTVELVP
jgi:predicted dehydrogenase